MDVDSFVVSVKWFILLAGAVTTGLFVRTMGQWAIDWAKEPYDNQKREKERIGSLKDIKSCLSQASRHIDQLDHFLSGRGAEDGGEEPGTVIIPTFNLDIALLEHHAPYIRKLVSESNVALLEMVRFELTHLRRRIDTLAGLLSLTNDDNWRIAVHVHGTRTLIDSSFKIVKEAINALDQELAKLPTKHQHNSRPLLVAGSFLLFALLLSWVAGWNATTQHVLR